MLSNILLFLGIKEKIVDLEAHDTWVKQQKSKSKWFVTMELEKLDDVFERCRTCEGQGKDYLFKNLKTHQKDNPDCSRESTEHSTWIFLKIFVSFEKYGCTMEKAIKERSLHFNSSGHPQLLLPKIYFKNDIILICLCQFNHTHFKV